MSLGKCGRAVQTIVGYSNKTRAVKDFARDMSFTVQFDLRGEDPFYVSVKPGEISFHTGLIEEASVTFRADAKIFFRIIVGDLDQNYAVASGKCQISGSITVAARFRRIIQLTLDSHKSILSLLQKMYKWAAH